MLKKKKKYHENLKYINLSNNILNFQDSVLLPNYNKSKNKVNINNNSCFYINKYINDSSKIPILNSRYNTEEKNEIKKISEKVYLILNNEQKHILKIWFKVNDLMYNTTLKYLKNNYINLKNEFENNQLFKEQNNIFKEISILNKIFNKNIKQIENNNKNNIDNNDIYKINIIYELKLKYLNQEYKKIKENIDIFLKEKPYYISKNKFKLNYQNIRTYILKNERNNIIKLCKSNIINKDIKIKTHILDATIKLACSNYQSSITNYENGTIKNFRIRYWKDKREKRVLEIEDCYFTKESLCPLIFGKLKGYTKKGKKKINFNFNIKGSCKLHYSKKTKEYSLFISKKISDLNIPINKNKNIIGIDLGLRTFATCLSENEIIEIKTSNEIINKDKLKRLINIRLKLKKNIYTCKIQNKLKNINKRIKGYIDELHWKTIKFLTDNYKTILIGDLSTKSIVNNNRSNLSGYNKDLAYALSFYTFRQRLKYKCITKKSKYLEVDEYYTSKTCSICSNYNERLGTNKTFNCAQCKTILDRDINGCRNIIIKCL
jgi:putative transposase